MKVTTFGIDLAKSIFQLHGVDAHGKVDRPEARDASKVTGDDRAAAAVSDWDGGVWECAVLGAGVSAVGAHGQAYQPPVCEAVCQRQ